MKTLYGIRLINETAKGVSVVTSASGLSIAGVLVSAGDRKQQRASVCGLPLNAFFQKTVILPELPKKELKQAVPLQIASALPWDSADAHVSHSLRKIARGHALHIVAARKSDFVKPLAIVPEPLALAGLAEHYGFLQDGQSALLVYQHGVETMTLCMEGHEPVFMRAFKADGSIAPELRLSAQSVYMRKDRTLIIPRRVVLFGETGIKEADVISVFGDTVEVLRPSHGAITSSEHVIAAGLALLSKYKKLMKGFNVVSVEVDVREGLMRGLKYTLPLWPVFLILYYYGSLKSIETSLAGVEGRIAALSPRYDAVKKLDHQVKLLEDFFSEGGAAYQSPQAWYEVMRALERSRPYGLWLTTISGRISDKIVANGKAEQYSLVTEYLKALEKVEDIGEPTLIYANDSGGGVDFQISFVMRGIQSPRTQEEAGR